VDAFARIAYRAQPVIIVDGIGLVPVPA